MTTPAYYAYPELNSTTDPDQYLTVEEVANRLGLPVGLVLRRVEAGDVPARRVDTESGETRWELRLADLGIEPETLGGEHGAGYGYAEVAGVIEVTGTVEMSREDLDAALSGEAGAGSWAAAAPAEFVTGESTGEAGAEDDDTFDVAIEVEIAETGEGEDTVAEAEGIAQAEAPVEVAPIEAEATADEEIDIEAMVPPPSRQTPLSSVTLVEAHSGPLEDIAGMSIDPRELVAGLLDRWERTLEQRIYAEQRQRFESELVSRQSMVKELQMELRTARAEHAAAQAEKDRVLADHNRKLSDIERELEAARRAASQAQIQLQAQQVQTRKRGWLFRR